MSRLSEVRRPSMAAASSAERLGKTTDPWQHSMHCVAETTPDPTVCVNAELCDAESGAQSSLQRSTAIWVGTTNQQDNQRTAVEGGVQTAQRLQCPANSLSLYLQ